jgi:endonuclease/exonuclease/phosphatase family metal-dependent hydrolase
VTGLRLGTFNALSGRSLTSLTGDPQVLAAAVARLGADVVALQEIDRNQERSGGGDQARLTAEAMGVHGDGYRFVATLHGTPGLPGWVPAIRPGVRGCVGDLTGGGTDHVGGASGTNRASGSGAGPGASSYGIALISRVPVRRWLVLGLGGTSGRYPLLVPGPRWRVMWLKDEPRAAVAAVLDEPRITVACAHLSFVPGRNAVQLRRVVRWLRTLPGPRVLLGDLNLPGRVPARLTGWTPLVEAPTYPSPAPRLQLDHILADALPDGARHDAAAVVRLPVSDHRAAVVTLHLP